MDLKDIPIDLNDTSNDIINNTLNTNTSLQMTSTQETLINTVEDKTIQIVAITASSMCCCFSIISYFIYKAHRKQQKKLKQVDVETGKKKKNNPAE